MSELDREGLRKVAVLITAVDQATADQLLDALPPPVAERVRQSVLSLDHIDPVEQERILREFFVACQEKRVNSPHRLGPASMGIGEGSETKGESLRDSRQTSPTSGFLGAGSRGATSTLKGFSSGLGSGPNADASSTVGSPDLLRQAFPQGAGGNPTAESKRSREPRGLFGQLSPAQAHWLSQLLSHERPQTIALVLSHLSPECAGRVLVQFPPKFQVEIIRRLIDLEHTDPELLEEIERALEARLAQLVQGAERRNSGLTAIRSIIEAGDPETRGQLLANLAAHDEDLARHFTPPEPTFEELASLDGAILQQLAERAEPIVLQLALIGAPQVLVQRIMGVMPPEQRAILAARLKELGPTALADVLTARKRLCQLAHQLLPFGEVKSKQFRGKTSLVAA